MSAYTCILAVVLFQIQTQGALTSVLPETTLPESIRSIGATAYAMPRGVIIATSAKRAEELAQIVESGAKQFKLHFGVEAPKVLLSAIKERSNLDAFAKQLGCAFAFPWFDSGNPMESRMADIRNQIKKQAPQATESDIDRLMKQVLQQMCEKPADFSLDDTLAHELGHLWLVIAFWGPHDQLRGTGHYGGPAADWLDEAASICLEPANLTASRYSNLRRNASKPELLVPLPKLFSMKHPAMHDAVVEEVSKSRTAGISVTALSFKAGSPEAQRLSRAEAFYGQIRSLIDFMESRAKRPGILGSFAAAAVKGLEMDVWLSSYGAEWGLPNTVAALETEWRTWQSTRR